MRIRTAFLSRPWPWPWLLLLSSLVSVVPAHAETTLSECGANPACLSLFEHAKAQSAQGNLPEALRLYKAAYEVRADPRLLFSIGRVLHKQGQMAAAAGYYQQFIDSGIQDEAQKQKVREYLKQVRAAQAQGTGAAKPQPGNGAPLLPTNSSSAEPTAAAEAVQLTSPTPETPAASKPVYKKWWFWTIMGTVAAAAIAGGVAGGILANQGQSLPEPGFHPFSP